MRSILFKTASALAAAALLSGCTYSTIPAFPDFGERVVPLASNLVCESFDVDGEPTGDDPQHYEVMAVAEANAEGEKHYQYHFFLLDPKDGTFGIPAVVSFHYSIGESSLYIVQEVTEEGWAEYGWYDPELGEFYFYEDDSMMEADQKRIAEEHQVVLDPFTRDYYLGIHGDSANIRGYLSEIGAYYHGGVTRCEDE